MNTLRTFRESISNGVQCCCEYVYAGTMNRTPTAACGLPKCGERFAIMQRPPTKCVANIPPGVGADSSCPYPNIIKCTYRITEYVFSFHHTRISVLHFVGVFIYAGTINRPLRLLTVCRNAADGLP